MAINKDKIIAAAQRYVQKGQLDKAIQEYLRIVEDQPGDVRTWLKVGDLYAKKGARAEATHTYLKVAEFYSAQGFYLKAVAVYKQVLKLDPSLYDVNLKLAELYQQLGLLSDALGQYEVVAAHLMRLGQNREALATLRRMVELDPDNVASRIKLAEGFSKEGMVDEAAEEFARACVSLREQGRREDFVRVAERLLYHRPGDKEIARELASIYLRQNDTKRALAKLHLCVKADPRDIPTLELLAQAFRMLGQTAKTVSVLREVARIHGDQGRTDERMKVIARIEEIDPNDTEVVRVRGGRKPAPAVPPPPAAPAGPPVPETRPQPPARPLTGPAADMLRRAVVAPVGRVATPLEEAGRVATPAEAPPARPSDRQRADAEIRRVLNETDVFLKYGLRQKAIEHLQRCFDLDPTNPEPRERLRDLYVQAGQVDQAVEVLFGLVEGFSQEPVRVAGYLEDILRIDPNNASARGQLASMRSASAGAPAPADPFEDDLIDSGVLVAPEADEVRVDASEFEDDFPVVTAGEEVVVDLAASDSEVGRQPEQPSSSGTATQKAPVPKAAPPPDDLPPVLRAEVSPPPDNVIPFPGQRSREIPLPAGVRPAQEVTPGTTPSTEVEESLEEADFFIAQGLYEEARALLVDLLAAHPGHRVISDRLSEVDELTGGAAPPEDASFELSARLAAELGEADAGETGEAVNVDQVFEQFKKGVEQQVGADDWATHLDLGIAYKEMGLLDDAIHEFELAASNPAKQCQCHTFVGLCHVEKGALQEAIEAFKKGLYVDQKTELEELGLYFELGNAHELLRDAKEALYYFQKVAKRDPAFRGVQDRIQALKGRPPPVSEQSAAGGDDVDRAFDDLVKSSK